MSQKQPLLCDRCKKGIEVPAYVLVQGSIMLSKGLHANMPNIFKCPEHQENYAQTLTLHPDCWIALLKEHGVPLHDMDEVIARYQKQHDDALLQEKIKRKKKKKT